VTHEASVDNVDFSPDEVVLGEGGFMEASQLKQITLEVNLVFQINFHGQLTSISF